MNIWPNFTHSVNWQIYIVERENVRQKTKLKWKFDAKCLWICSGLTYTQSSHTHTDTNVCMCDFQMAVDRLKDDYIVVCAKLKACVNLIIYAMIAEKGKKWESDSNIFTSISYLYFKCEVLSLIFFVVVSVLCSHANLFVWFARRT